MASRLCLTAAALALLVCAPQAAAKDGDGGRDARVGGTCTRGASAELRVRSQDRTIRVEFVVNPRSRRGEWRIVLVHERRVEWRGSGRASGSGGPIRVRRAVRDLAGPDQITTRASGPRGITCTASVTFRG
jgi:hypothetical protein